MIPTQLSFIRDRIEDLRYGDMYEKMVEECGKRLRCPKEQAISVQAPSFITLAVTSEPPSAEQQLSRSSLYAA